MSKDSQMRCLFLVPVLALSCSAFGADSFLVKPNELARSIKWPPSSTELSLFKKDNQYRLVDSDDNVIDISPELVCKSLRSVETEQLVGLLRTRKAFLKAHQCDDGEFTLDLLPRTPGGGIIGASFAAGAGEVVGKLAPMVAGYAILYGAKGVIRVTAGKEAADAFGKTMVEQSIPHLHEVSETIAHVGGGLGAIIGGIFVPG